MKITTLACDWCHDVKPAVASCTLAIDGKPSKGNESLDLCQGHLGALVRAFVPHKRTQKQVTWDRPHRVGVEQIAERYNTKKERDRMRMGKKLKLARARTTPGVSEKQIIANRKNMAAQSAAYWAQMGPRVLAVMPNSGTRCSQPEVTRALGLGKSTVYKALRHLVEAGQVKAHGPVGRYRRYERLVDVPAPA